MRRTEFDNRFNLFLYVTEVLSPRGDPRDKRSERKVIAISLNFNLLFQLCLEEGYLLKRQFYVLYPSQEIGQNTYHNPIV